MSEKPIRIESALARLRGIAEPAAYYGRVIPHPAAIRRPLDGSPVARVIAIAIIGVLLVLGVVASHHSDAITNEAAHASVSAAHAESTDPDHASMSSAGEAVLLGACVVIAICCVIALAIIVRRWMTTRARADIPSPPVSSIPRAVAFERPRTAPSLFALSVSRT